MSAEDFLDLLEDRQLLAEQWIVALRQQVAASRKTITPSAIARLLVQKGKLTTFQAKKLLSIAGDVDSAATSPPRASEKKGDAPSPVENSSDEELELLPLEEEKGPLLYGKTRAEDLELAELDLDLPEEQQPAKPKRPAAAPAALEPLEDLFDEEFALDASLTAGDHWLDAAQSGRGLFGRGRAKPGSKKLGANPWDSPLLLVGGGALAVLLIVGLVLFFTLSWSRGDELFGQAEKDYSDGAYGLAITKYEKFLAKFPDHPDVSKARVRHGLARLRKVIDNTKNPEKTLAEAQRILPEIESEQQFGQAARPELASLLPDIAADFADRAKTASKTEQKQKYVDLHREAMDLINNAVYLPGSMRKSQQARIALIQETIDTVVREINRRGKLDEAILNMEAAVKVGNTAGAYTIRKELLSIYPSLEDHAELHKAVLRISSRQREQVQLVGQVLAASVEDHPPTAAARIVLANRDQSKRADELTDHVLFVLAGGSVYALEAATGRVLWQRYVGYETTTQPVPVDNRAGADVLLVDGRRQELVRLEAKTGKLAWRLPLEEPAAAPVLADQRIIVAGRSGRLLEVDPQSGESSRHVLLPQSLSVAPSYDRRRALLYQLAEHSNLYVLSAETLECLEVVYLGHKAAAARVPPVSAVGHVFVVDNFATERSRIHVLAPQADGTSLGRPQKPLPLSGHVVVPPVVMGEHVLVMTNRGAIHVFQIDSSSKDRPVTEVARKPPIIQQPTMCYPLVENGRLWVADLQLTRYTLRMTRGAILRRTVHFTGDTFLAPLQTTSGVLLHVRRRKDRPGITVAATRVDGAIAQDDGQQTLWETQLAAGSAGGVLVDQNQQNVAAVSPRGAVYKIDAAAMGTSIIDQPTAGIHAEGLTLRLSQQIDLGQGRWLLAGDPVQTQVVLYDSTKKASPTRVVKLNVPGGQITSTPVPWAGGLLVTSNLGQVVLLDASTGMPLASGAGIVHPFQPRLEPGASLSWRRPAVVGEDSQEVILSDDLGTLYRLGIKQDPEPHLAQLQIATSTDKIVSPLAAIGDAVYGVVRIPGRDVLVSYSLRDLTEGQQWPLKGQVNWGPERVADMVMLSTGAEQLWAIEAGSKRRWTVPLPYGRLAGRPLVDGKNLLLSSVAGTVWWLNIRTGNEVGKIDIGEPLGSGAVSVGKRIFVSGSGGTVYALEKPKLN